MAQAPKPIPETVQPVRPKGRVADSEREPMAAAEMR